MAPSKSASHAGGFWKLLLILAAAVILFSIVSWFKTRKPSSPPERFSTKKRREKFSTSSLPSASIDSTLSMPSGGPAPLEPGQNEVYLPVSDVRSGSKNQVEAFPADRLRPEDLLPKDAANSKWAMANPAGQGDIKDQNFLTAGYHMGFNTQGSSMRNPSYDLRSTPANPRYNVSVWQQSTIEPDMTRRPLE